MSFLALDTMVQWLDNHHLLELSQREFKHGMEEAGKVIFKVPFPLGSPRRLGERLTVCPLLHTARPVTFAFPYPKLLMQQQIRDAENMQPLHRASCSVSVYEISLAAKLLARRSGWEHSCW